MAKVSVFGASGFVGSRYCALFRDECTAEERDAERPENDEILYLISTSHNYHVYEDLQIDIDTNLKRLMAVLEQCRGRDVTFNFVSSWFVYGTQETLPVSETAICRPRGFYSITKKCAEDLLVSFCRTFHKKYRILRLSNVYGPGDKFSKQKNALQYLIQRLVNDESIELYRGGDLVRDYLHVDDVCRGIHLCLEKASLGEVTNIGSGEPSRLGDLIEYCRKQLGSTSAVTSVDPPEFHTTVQATDFYMNVTRVKRLGFTPEIDIRRGLDDVMAAMKAAKLAVPG
ncbi:MAG TPA: NAD-dependent epimerase/dehydratase family protein [Polyangiaceae bacterium]